MDCKIIYKLFLLIIFFSSTQTYAIEFRGKFIQGHYIIGKTESNTEIIIDKKKVKVSSDGYFAFGIEKERKLDIVIIEGNRTIIKKIQKRKYNIQKIDGLPQKKVTPPEEFYARIKRENKLIGEARDIESDLQFFKEKFVIPVDDAIITGVYGSQRVLNGIPKWPHYGLDFAQKKGTPVKAVNKITCYFDLKPVSEPKMREYLATDRPDNRGKHKYTAEHYGIDRESTQARCKQYTDRFGVPVS